MESTWPEVLFEFAYIPNIDEKLGELADLCELEDWSYRNTETEHKLPILYYYLQYTYKRVAEQSKIEVSNDAQYCCFNTGLVSPAQEEIYIVFATTRMPGTSPWFFQWFRRKGEYDLARFSRLPEMATYFDDPTVLVLDTRRELRTNIEHIITENKERFPEPYISMSDYQLQTFIKGAIDNAMQRVKRNYKTAVPQYYKGQIQLLLPLCLTDPAMADLALVVSKYPEFYRASTCLTLDMAYSNARQLAKPDREWLQP